MSRSEKIRGLYAICDARFSPQYSHAELAELILLGGCKILQLRMKDENNLSKVKKTAEQIIQLKNKYDFVFIINDYVELAAALPVDGIHVGENDLPIAVTRQIVGPDKMIGYSSHSLEEAINAEKEGASYVALGAIFPTKTKGPGHPVQGLEKLKEVVENIKIPVVAIGGITRENIQSVIETEVSAIAMITALSQAKNVTEATRYFVKQCEKNQMQIK